MDNSFEIAIVGAGPAGLTAALYLARARKAPLVLAGFTGSALSRAAKVANYPGFATLPGSAIVDEMRRQLAEAGLTPAEEAVTAVARSGQGFLLQTDQRQLTARAVIWCAGAQARRLSLPEEPKYFGRGVSVCATCDGNFFRNKDVAVAAGAANAVSEALHLAELCKTVYFITPEDAASQDLQRYPNILPLLQTRITGLSGQLRLEALTVQDAQGQTRELPVSGLFTAVGTTPQTAPLKDLGLTDEKGAVRLQHPHCTTALPGFFAAGDVTDSPYRQAVSAAAQGCTAALDCLSYLRTL